MSELIVSFSRSAAEAAALTGAANYKIPANLLNAGAIKLKKLRFFNIYTSNYHDDKQRESDLFECGLYSYELAK